MYSTTQAMHTVCAQIFAGCMFRCMFLGLERPVDEDFHDYISKAK